METASNLCRVSRIEAPNSAPQEDAVMEEVIRMCRDCLGLDSTDGIDADTQLESLGFDSLDTLDAAFKLRSVFGVNVQAEDIANLWAGHIPVAGAAIASARGGKIIRREEPADPEKMKMPTVGDMANLIRGKMAV